MSMSRLPKQLEDFKRLLDVELVTFKTASLLLGEPLITLYAKVEAAFYCTYDVISFGMSNLEPAKDHEVMDRYFKAVKGVVDYKESTKDNKFSNHCSTVREAIVSLGWISVKPTPCPFINDMTEAGDYWANRVLLNNKGNEQHMKWVNAWHELISSLSKYVAQHFLTGFTWGFNKGTTVLGGPPPPPPPPPPIAYGDVYAVGDGARMALLNQLNQGSDITRNLKPINCGRLPGPIPQGPLEKTIHTGRPNQAVKAPARPPKFLLDGRKWVVEYQKDNSELNVENDDMSQSLAMFQCIDCSLQVTGKINSVVIDSCKKTVVTLKKDVISSVELIRCASVRIQCDGVVPLINLDNCDSVQIFLGERSRGVEVISSKSNSCNVCLLKPDGDYKELAMPEQIKTMVSGERLVSSVIEKN